MATYKLTVSAVYGSAGQAIGLQIRNENSFSLGYYGGTQSSDEILEMYSNGSTSRDYSIIVTKKTSGDSVNLTVSDILLIGTNTYSIGHFFYIDENGKLTYKTMYTNKPETITVSDALVQICNKTSSRLGGVIRRVKNRISNLCENRMEVAYGSV